MEDPSTTPALLKLAHRGHDNKQINVKPPQGPSQATSDGDDRPFPSRSLATATEANPYIPRPDDVPAVPGLKARRDATRKAALEARERALDERDRRNRRDSFNED